MRTDRIFVVFACAGLAAVLLLGIGTVEAGETLRLTVLHTSDLHGQVLPFDDVRGREAPGSLARVAAAVAKIRNEVEHSVLLLDSGDTLQGNVLEEFTHVRWGEPSPTIEAMNLIGYEAMAVGNHEFNFGLEVLRRGEAVANFPFLGANIVEEATGKPAFAPYSIRQYGDLRVGILGLITPNVPGWESPENYRGLRFEAMDEAARRWVAHLRTEEGCDLIIVLAHTGFEVDLETGEDNQTAYENYGQRLIRVEGIDLLLTGHAHEDLAPTDMNGIIVAQPSSRGRRLTRVDLDLVQEGDVWTVARWTGENLDLWRSGIDEALMTAFEGRRRAVLAELEKPLTTIDRPLSVRGCRLRDCAAQDLIHEVQLAATGADLSLASLLTDSTPDLAPGPVTRRWVRALYTYPNTLRVVKVTGAQVKDILEHAARFYVGLECSGSGGCELLAHPDVRHYNVDTIQGLTYSIDPTAEEGAKVANLRFEGKPLDLHAEFTLACNNYRSVGGGGFPHLATAEIVWRSSGEMPDLIIEYLEKFEIWTPEMDENWDLSPAISAVKRADRNAVK